VLRGAVARAEPGHAWAFIGPPGVGQQQAARALSAALNCTLSTRPGEPCGICPVCDRCARGAFAAYHELVPVGAMHRVDDVREEWLRAASRTPLEGTWKVLRVVDADRMNEAAANAFLKGLEEPPERTLWILDIADPDELPETILSRCRALRFAPWDAAELAREARRLGIADGDVELAVRVANGAPGTLVRLARPQQRSARRKGEDEIIPGGMDDLRAHRDVMRRLREEGPGASLLVARAVDEEVKRTTAAVRKQGEDELAALSESYGDALPAGVDKQIKDRSARREREVKMLTAQAAIDDLCGWLRDTAVIGAGGGERDVAHLDALGALEADAAALGPAAALAAVDLLLATREALERNVQQNLALEACLMELSTLTLTAAAR
jgi:DNA polymerase-3 subunit delta'